MRWRSRSLYWAHFGIQNEDTQHSVTACETALELLATLRDINAERYFQVKSVVNFGIGIHAGEAAYREIKTWYFAEKTVLGDMVSTASRIEALTKHFNVNILTSQKVYQRAVVRYDFKKMPPRNIGGKKELQSYWFLPVNEFK